MFYPISKQVSSTVSYINIKLLREKSTQQHFKPSICNVFFHWKGKRYGFLLLHHLRIRLVLFYIFLIVNKS